MEPPKKHILASDGVIGSRMPSEQERRRLMPKTITKKDLVERIFPKVGLTPNATRKIIQTFLDEIIEELAKGNRIEIREMFVFEPHYQMARKARNPKTNQPVVVPPRTVVRFKAGSLMRERVSARDGVLPPPAPW